MADKHTTNWPELAAALYDKLCERNAELTYDFANVEVQVPSHSEEDAQHARWRVNGQISIRARNQ
ncbi:conserved hypothetical protein [Ferrimonas balearica DSM 9799]|uniref:Uncharacterized protein n=1 Tax=Ferrimonas balearica (strain DSM 9799 / CCM 4581 / KCTC 23876 / PAT) TaxID=550540 RepID=E1SVA0_FERBD|nr:hypothetical protein [Ferrimonas balearica]MBY6019279.1 hypothetical protein [Halomonas denitrificans]ADN74254.1 conserved hypothetical protein [Ferrimonas balearica DSM 9799]MBW3166189.1 hypothetical protein [Ferrimonas balearica]MBY5981894.1 hypothetical protein [Ferrimonas balearica]MBY6225505.1 hypothetical protein [Ferrimonas balearica]